MVAERVFDRLRWVWGCVAVWFYGAFVALDGRGRGLGVRCGRVDVRRTLMWALLCAARTRPSPTCRSPRCAMRAICGGAGF